MKFFATFLLTVLLFACSLPNRQTNNAEHLSRADTSTHQKRQSIAFEHDYLKQIGDSVEIPDFERSLELSSKAEQKLTNSHESIIVMAFFTGRPIKKIPSNQTWLI